MDKTTSSPTDPRHIRIADYDYPLPDERIARFPLAQRDQAKLLTFVHGQIGEDRFCHLGQYLKPGGLMVFNDTKVINARLIFHKDSGARIEIFCLEPAVPADYALNLGQKERASWTCLVGNLKKWKEGPLTQQVEVDGHTLTLTATRATPPAQPRTDGEAHQQIVFSWDNPQVSMADILEAAGQMPIPPYLKRETQQSDLTDYQTVYAHWQGSVAAPTAGLHFTPQLMEDLEASGMELQNVTLHVGAGTFRPVKSEEAGGHPMHAERFVATRTLVDALLRHQARVTAVGTTSVRALESLYHIGADLCRHPDTGLGLTTDAPLAVSQWQPYDQPGRSWPTPMQALQALAVHMDRLHTDALHASTSIIIAPGYDYRFVQAMVTNFHQPHSTLLLLVAAFVGKDWRQMYDYALAHDFRFLSYGDGALLVP